MAAVEVAMVEGAAAAVAAAVAAAEVPPWCEIVVADFRGFIAGFYENCLARLLKGMEVTVGMAVASAERTIAVLVVSVPMHSVDQWRVRCFKL